MWICLCLALLISYVRRYVREGLFLDPTVTTTYNDMHVTVADSLTMAGGSFVSSRSHWQQLARGREGRFLDGQEALSTIKN
jgi:hypothetical protein